GRSDATVEVVHAWEPPVLVGSPVGTVAPVPVDGPYGEAARAVVAESVAAVDSSGVRVEQEVVEGPPGASLCRHAEGAALLVVASSGHGAVLDTLVGSVSQYCIHHAPCPAVIVPAPRRRKKH